MHPCCGTQQMEASKYSEWTAKKITLLTAEMATIRDTKSERYKKLAKQKRSQEDRLMKRKREQNQSNMLVMLDAAMVMLVKEVQKSLPEDKSGLFSRQLLIAIRDFK